MRLDKGCQSCGQQHRCHSIYYRLGHAEGPPVFLKVLLAFGIPLVVFIVTLAVAGTLLGGITASHAGSTLLSFVLALALTTLAVLGIWKTTQRPADHNSAAGVRRRDERLWIQGRMMDTERCHE